MTFHVKHLLLALALLCFPAWAGGEAVTLPGTDIELKGQLYRPAGRGSFPAIVMLHGCSGMWARSGKPLSSYEFWAEHFRDLGYVALLLDSFGPRREREICTHSQRRITPQRERASDARAALMWLAGQAGVRGEDIHLAGWSNGGSAVLQALRPDESTTGQPSFRSAIAFYPGCAQLLKGAFVPRVPLLILAGAEDDWTPAAKCQALARRAREAGAPVEIEVYEGAHHAFDRIAGSLRYRPEVRNPSSATGWGAHVGPHPEARRKALERATAFIQRPLGVPRGTGVGGPDRFP